MLLNEELRRLGLQLMREARPIVHNEVEQVLNSLLEIFAQYLQRYTHAFFLVCVFIYHDGVVLLLLNEKLTEALLVLQAARLEHFTCADDFPVFFVLDIEAPLSLVDLRH